MKHPPSKTIGPKLWLAKTWTNENALCPAPQVQISNGYYSFSPANFDPRHLTLQQARIAGKNTTLFPPYGKLFGAQIWRMAHEAKVGDIIILESKNRIIHAWGEISNNYEIVMKKKLSEKILKQGGIHRIGVSWKLVPQNNEVFKLGRGDKLLFREIAKENRLYNILTAFVEKGAQLSDTEVKPVGRFDLEYEEGGRQLRQHLYMERDSGASREAKRIARLLRKDRKLSCKACSFVPEKELNGLDIIEAHHSIPLRNGERKTKIKDFVMLCPCCHRAVHKLINTGIHPELAFKEIEKIRR